MSAGKYQRSSTGRRQRDTTNGKRWRNTATDTACCCGGGVSYYPARRCDTGALVTPSVYLGTDVLPAPFISVYTVFWGSPNNICVYFDPADTPVTSLPLLLTSYTPVNNCLDGRCCYVTGSTNCPGTGANAPNSIKITLAGISASTACLDCSTCWAGDNPGAIRVKASNWSDGTFCSYLDPTQDWNPVTTFGTGTFTTYSDTSCLTPFGIDGAANSMTVVAKRLPGAWRIIAFTGAAGAGAGLAVAWFDGTTSIGDCYSAFSVSNSLTVGQCQSAVALLAGSWDLFAVASGGTATCSFCCTN